MDKISVIVPIHNSDKTLDRCLESIVNQTYGNLEILLVNNASTDNSLKLCNCWQQKDNRIKVINLTEAGVSKARNAGLSEMTGDLFAFVDSDDSIELTMYEKLLAGITDKNADIAYCKTNEFKNGKLRPREEKNLKSFIHDKNFQYWFLSGNDYVDRGAWRSLYRTSKLGKIRFDERLSFHEDFVYSMQCIKTTTNLALVDECLYNYTACDNFNKKYTNANYVTNNKIGLEYSIDFLNYLGLNDWANAIYFLWLIHTVVNLLRYNDDGIKSVKNIFLDEFWKCALDKKNYKAYVNLFKDKSGRLKYLLLKLKMFRTYKFLLNHKKR